MDHRSLIAGLGAGVLAILDGAVGGAAPALAKMGDFLPAPASGHAAGVDGPLFVLYTGAAFAVILVTGLAVIFVRQFQRRDETARGAAAGGVNPIWLGLWLLGAAALGGYAFLSGLPGFLDQAVAPYGAYDIAVTARQWDYEFTYPNGHVSDTLTVPVGEPVRLTMASEDVLHGLSVPALRVSEAIVPGRTGEAWFEATAADTFALLASIFSGKGYGEMRTALVSLSPADFEAWMRKVSDIFAGRTMEEVGQLIYTRNGCMACHSLDGTKLIGPSFKDLYGHTFETREGLNVVADDAYIKESILYPNVSVIAGYEPVMTPYEGILGDQEIEAVTAWLKTLSSLGGTADAASDTTGAAAPQEESE